MQKTLKRHLKECKNLMLPHEYLIELYGKVSSKAFFDEFRDFMHKGSIDKYQFLRACHIEMTAEECVREIVLCCSLNETFTVFVRFSTDIIHPLNDKQAPSVRANTPIRDFFTPIRTPIRKNASSSSFYRFWVLFFQRVQ